MARNGSGTFSPSVNFVTEAASAPIEISKLDTAIKDLGDEITNSIAADGQTSPSANLPMNGKKHTDVAAATALDQYARVQELIDQDHVYYVDSGAANAYVITPDPAITAYEEGQRFVFRATTANTGASTLNVNSLGAIAIQTPDGQALASGAIIAGGYYEVVYDANPATDRWVLMSPPSEIPTTMLPSTVWTSANDGTGSGLDADTLDGSEGSAFAKLASSNTFTGSQQAISNAAPSYRLTDGTNTFDVQLNSGVAELVQRANKSMKFYTNGTLRAEITGAGEFQYGGVEVGFRGLPATSGGSGTFTASQAGGHYKITSSGATVTIPANSSVAYPIGTVLTLVNRSGGSCTIAITSDTMYLAGAGTTGSRTLANFGLATALKTGSTEWVISGSGLS